MFVFHCVWIKKVGLPGTQLIEQLTSHRGGFLFAEDRMVENVLESLYGFLALALGQENAADLEDRFSLPTRILLEGLVDSR